MDGSHKQTINFQKLGTLEEPICVSSDLTTKMGVTKTKLVHFMRKCLYFIGETFDMTKLVGFPHFNGQSYLFIVN